MKAALGTSIALCTYNGASFLSEQLASFATQTRLPDELIVCDDRSSDATTEILAGFARDAPFPVRLTVNDVRLGSTLNFSRAIHACSGDIVFLSDQDDVWREDKVERICAVFSERPDTGAVFTDATVVDDALRDLGYQLWASFGFTASEQRAFCSGRQLEVLLQRNVATGATMAFRRRLCDLVMPIPECWVHDGWIALLVAATSVLRFIPEPLILYRQHASNQIGGTRKSLRDEVRIAKATGNSAYLQIVEQCQAAKQRLAVLGDRVKRDDLQGLLDQKSRHFAARAAMPEGFFARLSVVAQEWTSQRYRRYSRGYRSLLKDLARPGGHP
jgi:glycosyltransferase involved in cell wall biosynthesis